jgi:hypothetical protein
LDVAAGVLEVPASEGSGQTMARGDPSCSVWTRGFRLPEVQCETFFWLIELANNHIICCHQYNDVCRFVEITTVSCLHFSDLLPE